MTFYFHQAYASQGVDFAYQDPHDRNLQQQQHMYSEPVIQQDPMYTEPVIQQQIYREEDFQQHTQLYRAEGMHQDTQICQEICQAPQIQVSPLQPLLTHICDICNKQCKSQRELQSHHARHTAEKAHICDVCHKGFIQKTDLQRHYLTHTGDKPHVCHVCNRSFALLGTLINHSMIHTGRKPHVCDICKRGFTRTTNLKAHYLTHTGEKNQICEICNKSFAQKGNLRVHYLVHSADGEGKRRRGKGGGKRANGDEETFAVIVEAKGVQQQESEQQREAQEMEQMFVEHDLPVQQSGYLQQEQHFDMIFSDNSGSHDQALVHCANQGSFENGEAFATLDHPLTHRVHQALNIRPQGLHALMTVDQQSLFQ